MNPFNPFRPDDHGTVALSRLALLGLARPVLPTRRQEEPARSPAAAAAIPAAPATVGEDVALWRQSLAAMEAAHRSSPLERALHALCATVGAGAIGYGGYAVWTLMRGDSFDRAVRLFLP